MSQYSDDGFDQLFLSGVDNADLMTLHSGDPGADGTGNVISDAPVACAWAAAEAATPSGRQRKLSAAVEFTGATPSTSVAYFGLWKAGTPNTWLGRIARASGDAATNAAGAYTVTTDTKIPVGMAS